MTTRWGRAAKAALVVGLSGVSGASYAEEILRQERGAACAPGGGCMQFQSYIYVRRNDERSAPVVSAWGAAARKDGEPQLGSRRLYLHVGAAEAGAE